MKACINWEYDVETSSNMFWVSTEGDTYKHGPYRRMSTAIDVAISNLYQVEEIDADTLTADRENEEKGIAAEL